MQVFEIVESTGKGSENEIILLGKKQDQTTVAIRVNNTPFCVYVLIPSEYEGGVDAFDFATRVEKLCIVNKKWCRRTNCSNCHPVTLIRPVKEENDEEELPKEVMQYLNTQPCVKKWEYDLRSMIDVKKTVVVESNALIGYSPNKQKFIRLHLTRPFFASTVKARAYQYMNEHKWPTKKVFGCHNNAVDGFLFATPFLMKEAGKCGERRGISSLTWLDMGSLVVVEDKKKTTCREEYTCEFQQLKRMNNPPLVPVKKKRYSIDIECSTPDIRRMCDSSKDPILLIRIYDGTEKKYEFMSNDEKGLLEAFVSCIERDDPDIMEGYNFNSFDAFYLRDRMIHHKIDLSRLCKIPKHDVIFLKTFRTSRQSGRKEVVFFDLPGRVMLDVFLYMKGLNRFADLSLKYVAAKELGHTKMDFPYENINPYFYGTKEQREELSEYCGIDAKLPYELDDKYNISSFYDTLAEVTGITFSKVITVGVQFQLRRLLSGFVCDEYLLESPPFEASSDDAGESYEGATVVEPRTGYYTDPIFVGDFNSLYPSIIITHNLSPDTFVLDPSKMNPDDYYKASNGHCFVKEHIKKGVLPRMCELLLSARAEMKSKSVEKGDVFDIYQDVLKRLANSIYGGLAAKGSAYYCPEIAATVTMIGRESIKKVIDFIALTFPKEDLETVYGDTDSVFGWIKKFRGQEDVVKKSMAFAYEIRDKIMNSGLFTGRMKLGIEGILYPSCITAKKCYFAYKYEKVNERKLYERGTISVKRENAPYIGKMFKKLSEMVLNFTSKEEVELFVRERIHTLLSAKTSIEDLSITKNYTKAMSEYANPDSMDSMRVVKLYMKLKPIETPQPGYRIKYALINNGNPNAKSCDLARPLFMIKHVHELNLNYYVQNKIRPAMTKFLEMFGMEEKVIEDIFTISRGTLTDAYLKCYNPLLRELQFPRIPRVLTEHPEPVEMVMKEDDPPPPREEKKVKKYIQTTLKFG